LTSRPVRRIVREPDRRGRRLPGAGGMNGQEGSGSLRTAYPAAAAVVLSAALLIWAGFADPLCNWDLVGYTACALELRGTPDSSIREETFGLLERSVPPVAYQDLTSSTPVRIARATDDESLLQHLPFYRIRFVYVALLAGLSGIGLNPLQAASAISTAAALAALLLLLRLVPGARTPWCAAAVVLGSLGTGLVEVARHATPDALGAFFVVACSAMFLRRRKAMLIMLPLCVTVRTDLLLFVLPLHAYAFARLPFSRIPTALSAASSLALAFLPHLAGGYGWGTTFEYTFLRQDAYPALLSGSVTPAAYLSVLRSSVASIPHSETWVFLFVAVLVLGMSAKPNPGAGTLVSDARFVLAAAGLSALIHFLVFPAAWPRFFAGHFATALSLTAFLCLDRTRLQGG